ncbi:MAG: hybrid sensor histidine kinase/response regulator [Granulosicoccus sp.]|nr:hybrid sensor histidine kinase/response regulator [Granulosicoccus sp.]
MIPAPSMDTDKPATQADAVRLLFVDDDPGYLDLIIRRLMRETGNRFSIDTASNIEEAVNCCLTNDYDSLLVDYLLPDGYGTDIVDRLNRYFEQEEQADRNAPPAIIVTADGGEHAAVKAIRAGAVDFLAKRDATPQALIRATSHAVEKSRLEASVRQRNLAVEHANVLLEKANAQLESKRREILSFYHTVSHEVKTPLAAAREFVSLVKDGAAGDLTDQQRELLGYAMDSCDQIKYQFTDLLELARIDSGKTRLQRKIVPLDPIVKRSVASVTELSKSKSISIEVSADNAAHSIYCDPERIVQVLSNLLTNAVKFTGENGMVRLDVSLERSSGLVSFRVSDTGCGIEAEKLDLIFERLYQIETVEVQENQEGLGLGLSICRELLTLHGSHLSVTSELGVGSQFSFELPQTTPTEIERVQ